MNTRRGDFDPSRRECLRALAAGVVGVPVASRATLDEDAAPLPREGVFALGDFPLQSGSTLRQAKLAYKTHGQLNAAKSNVILYPTSFAAQHGDIEWLIGPGRALDPDRYFVIVLDQLGNGLSSSPSNTPPPQDRMRFPIITIQDDIAAQHRLVFGEFGIRRVALVTGWSMGA